MGKILKIGNASSVGKRLKRLNELLQTDMAIRGILSELDSKLELKHNGQV